MNSTDDVRLQLRAILSELSRGARFGDSDDVFEIGVVRSLNLIELITWIEDTYGLEVTQRDVFDGNLRSVDRLLAFIVDKRRDA
ncbi:MAG: acyl carrier protein [Deltaproteobacteria bacterium]|nr:acyl carrier protein [Deltaproteobacteria bacterium]